MTRSAGIFAAGLALGCALAFAILSQIEVVRLPGGPTYLNLASASTKDLGRLLMGRVGERFIHHEGPEDWNDRALFYDEPKPYGSSLCRVNQYFVPEKIVRGGPVQPKEVLEDDLKVETLYAIVKRPTIARQPGVTLERLCADYRDFRHLIYETTILTVERAAYVMDVASEQARNGAISFALSCKDERRKPDRTCDPAAILRDFDLKSIHQVWMEKEMHEEHSDARVDQIWAEPPKGWNGCPGGGQDELSFRVQDVQHFGKQSIHEADIVSMEVLLDCID